jgi:hypothetical protein
MSVDDDEGLIDRCECERFIVICLNHAKSDFSFSPDAHLDVTPADAPPTRDDRTAAHVGIALSRGSVQERRTKILKQKEKSIISLVCQQSR